MSIEHEMNHNKIERKKVISGVFLYQEREA